MTPQEGQKSGWRDLVWIKLVGHRVCSAARCVNLIQRVTWLHPPPVDVASTRRQRDGSDRHVAPLPLSHRCYTCAAATFERERRERSVRR